MAPNETWTSKDGKYRIIRLFSNKIQINLKGWGKTFLKRWLPVSHTNSVEGIEYNGESKRDMREWGKFVGNSFAYSII